MNSNKLEEEKKSEEVNDYDKEYIIIGISLVINLMANYKTRKKKVFFYLVK